MPIYMDRHDLEGVTAEEVAEAHQADLAVQERHECKAMTYWFDQERCTSFCLIDAPSEDAVRAMHREAHGAIPTTIMPVDPRLVQSFLGRIADPEEVGPVRDPAFRAVLFTDMADSTALTNRLGDARAYGVVTRHRDLVLRHVREHGGREVDRAGDGFLLCFPSVTQAVSCATAIQREVEDGNRANRDEAIELRMGLGAGEPVTDGKELFGSVVNLTARVCDAARPGEILAQHVICELCRGKGFTFVDRGEVSFKGFPDPVRIHEVLWRE